MDTFFQTKLALKNICRISECWVKRYSTFTYPTNKDILISVLWPRIWTLNMHFRRFWTHDYLVWLDWTDWLFLEQICQCNGSVVHRPAVLNWPISQGSFSKLHFFSPLFFFLTSERVISQLEFLNSFFKGSPNIWKMNLLELFEF